MYELTVSEAFAAAHQLRGYEGKCERLHGHNWRVEATLRATALDSIGMALDFKVIKKALRELADRVEHQNLNDVPPFVEVNPTSEHLAEWFFHELSQKLNSDHVAVHRVTVAETDSCQASYCAPSGDSLTAEILSRGGEHHAQ